jgi:hypothetical protein
VTLEELRIAVRRSGAPRRRRRLPAREVTALTAEQVRARLRARPAAERPALLRAQLARLPAHERARLLALSGAAARGEVLERLAQRGGAAR